MHNYYAYGYGISSELLLPELPEAECGNPSIRIRRGRVDRTQPEGAYRGVTFWATASRVCFVLEGVGALLVEKGEKITVDPDPDVDESVIRLQILGPALAILLHQKGFLVLHASAVSMPGGAVAFMGAAEWGKSTMAATFHSKGYELVADDYLAVDFDESESVKVQPGFPQMKLWPDAATSLGEAIEMMPVLHPRLEKRAHRIESGFRRAPVALARVYVLADGECCEIEAITGQEALLELVRHSYTVRLLEATGARESHFRQCGRLVQLIPIRRLRRPKDLAQLPDLTRLVEDDLGSFS